jgi:hypothetical protein
MKGFFQKKRNDASSSSHSKSKAAGKKNDVQLRPKSMLVGLTKPVPPSQEAPKATASQLHSLYRRICRRYELDLVIWSLRDCRTSDRIYVEEKMKLADQLLDEILQIICLWSSPAAFESPADYKLFEEVKRRIEEPGKRIWMKYPPWAK